MAKTNNAAPATLEEALAALEVSKNETADAFEVIADLKKQLADKSSDLKKANKEHTVKHGGKEYKVVIPSFNHNGVIIKAHELAENKTAIKELVEMESGVLEEI